MLWMADLQFKIFRLSTVEARQWSGPRLGSAAKLDNLNLIKVDLAGAQVPIGHIDNPPVAKSP